MIEETQDAELVHRLTQSAFAEYGREPGTSTALKETVEAIEAQLRDGNRALVLLEGNVALACVRFRFEGDALYFHRLSVDPAHRRRGLACALSAALEDIARAAGLRKLTCSVRLAKEDNIALYLKLGFTQTTIRSVCRDGSAVPTGDFEKIL
jgi:ribosomal protein S18 acetylase RimI-like enzyme